MQQDWGIIFAFGLYFLALFGIGIFHMKKEQDLAGYVLGGRKVGPWVSAMSAEASDMSGWMLMGLPGYAYVAGVSAFWIAIGLAIGTWLNWLFVAKRLRVYTKIANDSITLPDFFAVISINIMSIIGIIKPLNCKDFLSKILVLFSFLSIQLPVSLPADAYSILFLDCLILNHCSSRQAL